MVKRGPVQGTDEWLEARRGLITATDLPVILGLSPWKSELELADEKRGLLTPDEETPQMRMGRAMEDLVREEVQREKGWRLRHVRRMLIHPTIPWAAASLDFVTTGDRRIVECKVSGRREWEDGIPEDVEAQVRWQMGVAGIDLATVAVWYSGRRLLLRDVSHDPQAFAGLVRIAADFRARLAAGGPFTTDKAYPGRRWPRDDGAVIPADGELEAMYQSLLKARTAADEAALLVDRIEGAIKARMGEVAVIQGSGWRITWRKARDSRTVDWAAVGRAAVEELPAEKGAEILERSMVDKPGTRRFLVTTGRKEGDDDE